MLIVIREIQQELALEESLNICHSFVWQSNHHNPAVHDSVPSIPGPCRLAKHVGLHIMVDFKCYGDCCQKELSLLSI